jgi:hypothetical protein
MNKKKTLKKIIPFWEDTGAISPVVATILVLAVAVAAGLGLYLWFNPFQASVQGQVGNSTTGQIKSMAIDNAQVKLSPIDPNPTLVNMDADSDTAAENPSGNGRIRFAGSYTDPISGLSTNGKNGVAWIDERFVVDIPIRISSNIALEDMNLTYGKPIVNVGTLYSNFWLHLDKNNDYQLLKKDGTPFVGFINKSTDKVFDNATDGYTYHFKGSAFAGLDIKNYTANFEADTGIYTTKGLSPPQISKKADALGVMKIYSDGDFHYALAKNKTGSTFGWVTCDYRSGEDRYFVGNDKLGVFHSPTYKVTDKIVPNEAVTVNTYFMFTLGMLDNYNTNKDDGYAEIVLPFTITTKEGVTATSSVTLTIKD